MADTFSELHAKRADLDRDVATIISLADTIETRLRAATGTVRPPDPRDRRSRGRKGPSDPTGGTIVGAEDYAGQIRSRWHELIVGHKPTIPTGKDLHRCPDLDALVDDWTLDTECLAGMVARAGGEIDGLTGRELDDTNELANRLQDCWHLLYQGTAPPVYVLGSLARDLTRIRGVMQALADDLRLWSDEVHPGAANRCPCHGAGCNHTTRCRRVRTDAGVHCPPCRNAQSRRRRATA